MSRLCLALHLYRPRVGGEVRDGGVWLEGEGGRAQAVGRSPNADITDLYIYVINT